MQLQPDHTLWYWCILYMVAIRVQCCVLMTTSHSSRCGKSLYMYEEDLQCAWSGWGDHIITYSMIQGEKPSESPTTATTVCVIPSIISGWGGILMASNHSRMWLGQIWYEYEVDLLWVWSWWGISIIMYNMIQVHTQQSSNKTLHS
jgi:hypothetical protein